MESIVYVGQSQQARALDIEFTRHVPLPVPPRIAQKLLRSSEFVTQADFEAQQAPPSPPPATEPVVVTPVRSERPAKPRR